MKTFYTNAEALQAQIRVDGAYLRLPDGSRYRLPQDAIRVMDVMAVPDDVPFYLRADGSYEYELNAFLLHLASTSADRANTWRTYASHIAMFAEFMELRGRAWKSATREDLEVFARLRLQKHKVEPRTWNVGVAALSRLFRWAFERDLIPGMPWHSKWAAELAKSGVFVGASQDGTPYLNSPEGEIRYVTLEEFRRLRDALQDSGSWQPARTGVRNRGMANVLIRTGMRINEANWMRTAYLPDPDADEFVGTKTCPYRIQKLEAKGGKPRTIRIHKPLLRDLYQHMDDDRRWWVERAQKRDSSYKDPGRLWLSEDGSVMTTNAWRALWHRASDRCGVECTPHFLRHTFAIYFLSALIRKFSAINELKETKRFRENPALLYDSVFCDPLREVQKALGHKDIKTTMIYLDFLREANHIVDEAIEEYSSVIGGIPDLYAEQVAE